MMHPEAPPASVAPAAPAPGVELHSGQFKPGGVSGCCNVEQVCLAAAITPLGLHSAVTPPLPSRLTDDISNRHVWKVSGLRVSGTISFRCQREEQLQKKKKK